MPSHPTFIVIGAQKAATSSLFQWLLPHPEVYLPGQKELEFFSDDHLYERGFAFYCERWFREAGGARAIGEVSPQYMMSSSTPARIAQHLPQVKLIAVLRNPIDRAFSHYAMSVRRGLEVRSFADAVDVLVARGYELTAHVDEMGYLSASLYGRIIEGFHRFFPKHSLTVLFYEELLQDPEGSLRDVYRFIGVDPNFVPKNIRAVFNRGGDRRRFPRFESWMMRQATLKRLVKTVIPHERLSKFLFWFDTELNVVRSRATKTAGPDASVREKLQHYYLEDVQKLEGLLGREVPWSELRSSDRPARRSISV
jgi:hypothetical protein